MDTTEVNSQPIFILGAHKSGTSLMRSLLDGHPDLSVIPFEAHVFRHLSRWIQYPYQAKLPEETSRERFIQSTKKWIREVNINQDSYADKKLGLVVDENIFDRIIQTINSMNLSDIVSIYYKAICEATKKKNINTAGRFVEKSVEQAEYAVDLKQAFPGAKFIHIIRNPYVNMVSIRRYKGIDKYPDLEPISKSLYSSSYYLYRNKHLIDDYNIIKYEDLVSNTEVVMKSVCNAIGVNFDEKVLMPTSQGELWRGNSITDEAFVGVTSERIKVNESDVTEIEKEIINKYFFKILEEYNYPVMKKNRSLYFRNNKEDIKTYIKNRSLLLNNQL